MMNNSVDMPDAVTEVNSDVRVFKYVLIPETLGSDA